MRLPFENRGIERQLRRALTADGYAGKGARFRDLDLAAIARPGWIQVFTFHVEMRSRAGDPVFRFGVVRDDERAGREYRLYETEPERRRQLDAWSEGLIRPRRSGTSVAPASRLVWLLLGLFAVVVSVALVSSVVG